MGSPRAEQLVDLRTTWSQILADRNCAYIFHQSAQGFRSNLRRTGGTPEKCNMPISMGIGKMPSTKQIRKKPRSWVEVSNATWRAPATAASHQQGRLRIVFVSGYSSPQRVEYWLISTCIQSPAWLNHPSNGGRDSKLLADHHYTLCLEPPSPRPYFALAGQWKSGYIIQLVDHGFGAAATGTLGADKMQAASRLTRMLRRVLDQQEGIPKSERRESRVTHPPLVDTERQQAVHEISRQRKLKEEPDNPVKL
ncbi:hypothetical protein OBBRIDRAFT_805635 [Obba rivulosa]|uniref:Uncharacterized protein n=1 Tax=Obba rivulosa TaxID=1052685 RepID=A0A8E2DIJ0_9APHY|nr:hypothetical protein OBBRIDRAFT_805635 [Obba rivulosa]